MERIGDILQRTALIKPVRKSPSPSLPSPPPTTLAQNKLLEAATAIRLDPAAVDRAYIARQLVQCTLPHRNPGDVPVWTRKNGNLILGIQPAMDTRSGKTIGYPYGTIPRLLLFWLTTEAVRTKQRHLELGNSLSQFMRELGLIPASERSGVRSDAKRLRDQIERLFRCRISFDEHVTRSDGTKGNRWLDMQVAPKGEYWWDVKQPDQATLWGSWLELGEDFFNAIIASPVPADLRALRALKRSPLALDLYVWLTYRVYTVNRTRQTLVVTWDSLSQQLGGDYDTVKNFRSNALKAIRKITTVCPGLNLSTNLRGRLVLRPSRLPIAPTKNTKLKIHKIKILSADASTMS